MFQHGADSPGRAPARDWRRVIEAQGPTARLVALDQRKDPHDIGSLGRYGPELAALADEPTPWTPLEVAEALAGLRSRGAVGGHRVRACSTSRTDESDEPPLVADRPRVRSGRQLQHRVDVSTRQSRGEVVRGQVVVSGVHQGDRRGHQGQHILQWQLERRDQAAVDPPDARARPVRRLLAQGG